MNGTIWAEFQMINADREGEILRFVVRNDVFGLHPLHCSWHIAPKTLRIS